MHKISKPDYLPLSLMEMGEYEKLYLRDRRYVIR